MGHRYVRPLILTIDMNIGFFDSGIGGVAVAKSIIRLFGMYKYVYLADDLHMPYGQKSPNEIFDLTTRALRTLFERDCLLVILACNSASSVLPRIQREWLPVNFPERKVLGVIRPTAEDIADHQRHETVYILATPVTVQARSFGNELVKIGQSGKFVECPCAGLAEAVERSTNYQHDEAVRDILTQCLRDIPNDEPVIIYTGCTHYAYITDMIRSLRPLAHVRNQGRIVSKRLRDYLERHPGITAQLSLTTALSLSIVSTSQSMQYHTKLEGAFSYHFSRI